MNNKTLRISEQKHKRKTILIIGFGQVGKKILAMKSFSRELRSMKFVCACRTEIRERRLYQKQTSFLFETLVNKWADITCFLLEENFFSDSICTMKNLNF